MKYFKKLIGNKVYLSPINVDDFEKYTEWLNDIEVCINLTLLPMVITIENEKKALEKLADDNNIFAIVDKENDKLIGNCGFHNIDTVNRRAEIGIFIGDKNYWSKGYGQDAIQLLLDFGFNVRNYHSIMLIAKEFNKRAIRCYEKCGFKKIGIRREASILGDIKYGEIYMDILSCEFKSKYINGLIKDRLK